MRGVSTMYKINIPFIVAICILMVILMMKICLAYPENNTEGFKSIAEGIRSFGEGIHDIILSIRDAALIVLRVAGGTLALIGLTLWATELNPYKGKKMVLSGLALTLIVSLLNL